jgi:hypothetical protein
MPKPLRLRLSRRKGFDLQRLSRRTNGLPAVVVSRPAKWSNPWRIGAEEDGHVIDRTEAIARYRTYIRNKKSEIRRELRGKNLACWCEIGVACHADFLLKIANAPERKRKSVVAAKQKPNQNQHRDRHTQNP